jgi:hypothetical protein
LSPPRGRTLAIAGVTVLFLALSLGLVLNHEMWRDELEIWLVARDSAGPIDLLRNMATEGHPALWYALNFLLSRFTSNPLAMQLLHVLLATVAVAVFLTHAPFPWSVRLSLVFGYYMLYEYAAISRNYVLVLLLGFAVCAVLARRSRLDGTSASLLFLLANTHLFGTIFAGLLGLTAVVGTTGADLRAARPRRSFPVIPALVVLIGVGIGFGHTLAQALAIGEAHAGAYRPGYDLSWVLSGLGTVLRGFLPFPDPTAGAYWNSNVIDSLPAGASAWVGALGGIAALAVCARALRARRGVLVVWALGATTMLAITLFVWHGFARHHGMQAVWFLLCAWIAVGAWRERPDDSPGRSVVSRLVLVAILAVQPAACALVAYDDLRRPFSNARAVARYLARETANDLPLVGSIDYAIQPVSAFLGRPFYYPENRSFGTFVNWGPQRRMVSPAEAIEAAVGLLEREDAPTVGLVLTHRLPIEVGDSFPVGDGATMTCTAHFAGAIVPDENYRVFRIERVP